MFGISRRIVVVAAAAVAGLAGLAVPAAAAPAAPPTLAGAWAPMNRCPVDAAAMLAADGITVAASCVVSTSPSGSIKLGSTTVPTGRTDLQLGLLNKGGVYTAVAPAEGAIIAEPVQIPGGLLGLMCPSEIPVISDICDRIVNSDLNRVTATIQVAGPPRDFNLGAGVGSGQPIVTLPVKIRLSNPFLEPNCYIGSNSNPILLKPANVTRPAGQLVRFNADGSVNPTGEMGYISLTGAAQADTTFAVPGAQGCGLFGLLSGAVNLKQGLPSAAGKNRVTLNDAVTNVGGFQTPRLYAPTQGQQLADRWHAAVVG